MTLLATKIAEIVEEALATKTNVIWRGILSTQEWKVLVFFDDANNLSIRVKRRDNGSGDPE